MTEDASRLQTCYLKNMNELSPEEIKMLQNELLQLQQDLQALLDSTTESVQTVDLDQPIGRLSRMDAIQQQKMAKANRAAHQLRAKQVVVALSAIESEEYGFCRLCEEPIGFKRLQAKPEAPFCVGCQAKKENQP